MTHTVEISNACIIMFYVFLTLLVYYCGKYHEYLMIAGIEQEKRGKYRPPSRHRYNLRTRKNL